MRGYLSDQEIASYQLNGFVVVQDFLDDRELAHWRRVTEAAVVPPRAGGLVNYRGLNQSNDNPEIAALWRSPGIAALVSTLGGFQGVRHLADFISHVQPGHGATPWHCGMHEQMPLDSASVVTLHVHLDEVTWDNKATVALPGSHRMLPLGIRNTTPSMRAVAPRFEDIFADFPELRKIEPVTLEGRAGMAYFANALNVHGSAPNMTPRARRKTAAVYISDGEVWNGLLGKNLATEVNPYEGMSAGDPLTDKQAPLIWTR